MRFSAPAGGMLLVSIFFMAALFGLIYAFAGKPSYLIAWGGWMVAFWAYIAVECVRLTREVESHPYRARSRRVRERDGAACRLDRDGLTIWRPGLPERSDPARAPSDRHQPEPSAAAARRSAPRFSRPGRRARGSLAAGSRSATTPEASCWRLVRRPAD